MIYKVLRKLRSEIVLLSLAVTCSITLCSFLIADAAIGLALEKYGLTLTVLRVFELVFAVTWLLFSMNMFRETNWLSKTLYSVYSMGKLQESDQVQKKDRITELVRNVIVFYRKNYLKFTTVTILAIAVSLSIILTVTYLLLSGTMSFWVAVFRWAVNSSMLLIASVLYIYINRGWRRKLSKVKDAEKKLEEMLGGPIET